MTSEAGLAISIPRWLRSPHLQTIASAVPLFSPPRSHARETVDELRFPIEGGLLHARAWWQRTEEPRPLIVLLHGIASSGDANCCVRGAVALHRAGYHVARLDMRAAGPSVADAPSLYHAGLTSDLDVAVRALVRDPRVASVSVLGYSGGGSIALKLAGEWASSPPPGVRAVAAISAPLDYTRVAARMDSWPCLPYRFHVLRGLLDRARTFAERHPLRAHYRPSDLASIKRFRAFDGEIIVPMHGFSDVDRYYADASSGPLLRRIEVPTLLVHAEDDPMVPGETVRPWLAGASPMIRVAISTHGGHIGWLAGLDEESWVSSWAMRRALAFLRDVLA